MKSTHLTVIPLTNYFGTRSRVTARKSEVDRLSRDFAAYLQNDLGIKKGDRVAMMAPNTLVFAVGMFGVIRTGAIQVNVNPLYSPREF